MILKNIQKLLKEPMVSFLLLGALIYYINSLSSNDENNQIVLTSKQVEMIVSERELAAGNKLSQEEREAAVKYFVDREILVREAIARGLPLKDSVI